MILRYVVLGCIILVMAVSSVYAIASLNTKQTDASTLVKDTPKKYPNLKPGVVTITKDISTPSQQTQQIGADGYVAPAVTTITQTPTEQRYTAPACDEAQKANIERQRSSDIKTEQDRHVNANSMIADAYRSDGSPGYHSAMADELISHNRNLGNIDIQYQITIAKIHC